MLISWLIRLVIGVLVFFVLYGIILFLFEKQRITFFRRLAENQKFLDEVKLFSRDSSGMFFSANYSEKSIGGEILHALVKINTEELSNEKRYLMLERFRQRQEDPEFNPRKFLPALHAVILIRDEAARRYIMQIMQFEEMRSFKNLLRERFFEDLSLVEIFQFLEKFTSNIVHFNRHQVYFPNLSIEALCLNMYNQIRLRGIDSIEVREKISPERLLRQMLNIGKILLLLLHKKIEKDSNPLLLKLQERLVNLQKIRIQEVLALSESEFKRIMPFETIEQIDREIRMHLRRQDR